MGKKGLTLIELVVAMTIFIIVMTLAVGGFVAISKTRATIGQMKDAQQKVRLANEMIIRYAKEAEYVQIDTANGSWLELYFNSYTSAKKFAVISNDLMYYDCTPVSGVCSASSWGTGTSLLGGASRGISLNIINVFGLSGVAPAVLNVTLALADGLSTQNAVILGGLK